MDIKYNLYNNGERVNSKPLTRSDMETIATQSKVTIMKNKKPHVINTKDINVVKVYVV